MNGVLADTSVWIAYLKGRPEVFGQSNIETQGGNLNHKPTI